MQLFIESSDPKEILQAKEWGIIDGVICNPTLISQAGPDMQETLRSVLEVSPGVVLCQVIGGNDLDTLVSQARWLHRQSEKIIVMLPMSPAGLQALQALKAESPTMQITVTAIASVAQAYLAAKCGADVVGLFNGQLEESLDQPVDLVRRVRTIFRNYALATKTLSYCRLPRTFADVAEAGTDLCTLRFEFLKMLFENPLTEKRLRGQLNDWQAVFGNETWPKA